MSTKIKNYINPKMSNMKIVWANPPGSFWHERIIESKVLSPTERKVAVNKPKENSMYPLRG